jgi:hypothetical protein
VPEVIPRAVEALTVVAAIEPAKVEPVMVDPVMVVAAIEPAKVEPVMVDPVMVAPVIVVPATSAGSENATPTEILLGMGSLLRDKGRFYPPPAAF